MDIDPRELYGELTQKAGFNPTQYAQQYYERQLAQPDNPIYSASSTPVASSSNNAPVRRSTPVLGRGRTNTQPQQQAAPMAPQMPSGATLPQQQPSSGSSIPFMPTRPQALANESMDLSSVLKDNWGMLGLVGLLSALSRMNGRNTAGEVIGGAGLDSLNALGGLGNAIQAQRNTDQENQRKYDNAMAQLLLTNQQHQDNMDWRRQQEQDKLSHWAALEQLRRESMAQKGSGKKKDEDQGDVSDDKYYGKAKA